MGKPSVTKTFSHVTSEVKGFLKEALEVPPEEPKQEELSEEELMDEQELQEPEELVEEIEKLPVDESQKLLAELNSATSIWKETGDLQVHLEPPVPLSTRMKATFHQLKEKSAPGFHHAHDAMKALMKRFSKIGPDIIAMQEPEHVLPTVHVTESHSQELHHPKSAHIEQEIMNDWMAVFGKGEAKSDARKEIEELYHELSVKN